MFGGFTSSSRQRKRCSIDIIQPRNLCSLAQNPEEIQKCLPWPGDMSWEKKDAMDELCRHHSTQGLVLLGPEPGTDSEVSFLARGDVMGGMTIWSEWSSLLHLCSKIGPLGAGHIG